MDQLDPIYRKMREKENNKKLLLADWSIKMIIRKAEETDIPIILELLKQVLQIHADIRPDIFIPGTTKYTADELMELLKNDEKPIYVAVDEDNVCVGYAFCQLQEQPFQTIWCHLSPFLLMIYVSVRRHGAGILVNVCLNMLKTKQSSWAVMK